MALLNVTDVMQILGVPKQTAYGYIRQLNQELKDKGYLVLRGRIEERYLLDRFKLSTEKQKEDACR